MTDLGITDRTVREFPGWVPDEIRRYITHTEQGISIRAIARGAGCHASTVLRQVRKCEARRDDLLIDQALRRLGRVSATICQTGANELKDPLHMQATAQEERTAPDDATIEREARRILRRLNEPGACIAVANDMEKAVVVRDASDGRTVRTGVVDRAVAEALALKDWISSHVQGRVSRYRITATGRVALKRLIAEEDQARAGMAEAPGVFGEQHRSYATRDIGAGPNGARRRVRYNTAESPLLSLARRKDKDGTQFLSDDLVAAGERLREDFELAQMGPRTTQNWDKFLVGGALPTPSGGGMADGPRAARDRVMEALADLGPGLGDVALRCCCFLEGMEAAERRMGWSARSGKIVLRIALQRLKRHYELKGNWSPLIG